MAIFVAVAFIFTGCGKKSAEKEINLESGADSASVEEFQTTIEEMAKSGKPYECTYSTTYENISQEGTIYFAGEDKIRGDIQVNMPETGNKMTHFIKDGEKQYIWSDGQPTGIVMTISKEEEEKIKAEASQTDQSSVDMNMKMNMRCKRWSPNNSVLTPPSNIQFQDLSEMMGAALGGGSGESSQPGGSFSSDDINMCAICDKIPAGAARDSCKASNC